MNGRKREWLFKNSPRGSEYLDYYYCYRDNIKLL